LNDEIIDITDSNFLRIDFTENFFIVHTRTTEHST